MATMLVIYFLMACWSSGTYISSGLVDFPSLRAGRMVYLCWRVDEETITHWHESDEGFAGRQPLGDANT